jgi:hypothetical protein
MALHIAPNDRLVLMAFRGAALSRIRLPPPRRGWRFIAAQPFAELRADSEVIPPGMAFADVLAASDVVVAKTGYGILADCAATGRPLLWGSREGFPEDQVLEAWLTAQPWAQRLGLAQLTDGTWATALSTLLAAPAPPPLGEQGAVAAAEAIAELIS